MLFSTVTLTAYLQEHGQKIETNTKKYHILDAMKRGWSNNSENSDTFIIFSFSSEATTSFGCNSSNSICISATLNVKSRL